ncbi:MAG: NeuD/PglB/VioB family sugar acetyltransferase [Bacteroidales bacterium]|nr:NeuD/PglB/VioB family sugar acetyltransferase [Bacteroidales bacterium]MBR6466399.1 NeuD/PglB/VioB family sugar acetyltransferase [Bacteroidales bacterium]
MKDIAIVGYGGMGREVACFIDMINKKEQKWNLIGFFDDNPALAGKDCVLGPVEDLNRLERETGVVIAVGNPAKRKAIVERLTGGNLYFPNIICPDCCFFKEDDYKMGRGNIVGVGCLISLNVAIGDFNILNNHIALGHDVTVGDYNSMMLGTKVCGACNIGNGNYFGVNATVLQTFSIGNNTVIGTGSVIMKDTKDDSTYFGNPAICLIKKKDK